MTIRALWFLSYLGVGLALAVGNRLDSPVEVGDSQEHPREKLDALSAAKTNLHLRAHQYDGSRRDVDHDWLAYDEQPPSGLTASGLRASGNELRRYRDVFFDELNPVPISTLLPRRAPPREPLSFIYEEAIFQQQQQQHHASKRPRGFKQAKKVVGLPPLVYGGSEEETPPGQSEPGERSNLDELFEQNSRSTAISFENLGGLPFEPPDSPHKPQGGGIGLSPLLFDTEKPPGKRTSSPVSGQGPVTQQFPAPPGGAAIASQFMLRSARGNRQYDVPQIECPSSEDGMERFACPTPDRMGRYRCIDDHVLCDGFIDCPTGEDEDRQACMFYKTTKAHLDVLADALLRWARGR